MSKIKNLIVNADDFGLTSGINRGIIKAHQDGILTSASLMVGGEGFEDAIKLARANPALGVGLHLALTDVVPVLPADKIPGLVINLKNKRFPDKKKFFYRKNFFGLIRKK